MYATDFIYDDKYLSDYGFIICDFDYTKGADIKSIGSEIVFNKISTNNGNKYSLTNTKYENCIETVFDICKDPELFDDEFCDRIISEYDYQRLVRWLNRKEFLPFNFRTKYDRTCYFDASFNIEKIYINDILFGLRLSMVTNRPFGYGEEEKIVFNALSTNSKFEIMNKSDEIGYIYPNVTIEFNNGGGTFELVNESYDEDGMSLKIENCILGERIDIDGEHQVVSSTMSSSHNICNDFNYRFFKIGNTFASSNNKILVSLPCIITITYKPIIKNIN